MDSLPLVRAGDVLQCQRYDLGGRDERGGDDAAVVVSCSVAKRWVGFRLAGLRRPTAGRSSGRRNVPSGPGAARGRATADTVIMIKT